MDQLNKVSKELIFMQCKKFISQMQWKSEYELLFGGCGFICKVIIPHRPKEPPIRNSSNSPPGGELEEFRMGGCLGLCRITTLQTKIPQQKTFYFEVTSSPWIPPT